MDDLISLVEIGKSIDGVAVLRGVSFRIAAGEAVALIGPSGSGKTTILRLIAGLERPSTGKVLLDGEIASEPGSILAPSRRGIGMVFQRPALWPHLTVEENVAFGLQALSPAERSRRLREVLALTSLGGFERRHPHRLSGGEGQRVALARALAPAPRILLLDEPLTGLDPELHASMLDLFRQVRGETGVTMLYVSHDHEETRAIADRVLKLRRGVLEHDGPWEVVVPEMSGLAHPPLPGERA